MKIKKSFQAHIQKLSSNCKITWVSNRKVLIWNLKISCHINPAVWCPLKSHIYLTI